MRNMFWHVVAKEPSRDIMNFANYTATQTSRATDKIKEIKIRHESNHFKPEHYKEMPAQHIRIASKAQMKILLEKMEKRGDSERIVQKITGREMVFVDFNGMLESNPEELKYLLSNVKKKCDQAKCQIVFPDRKSMIVVPASVQLERK